MEYKQRMRYITLCVLLLTIWTTQLIPVMGKVYADHIYPVIAYCLSFFSRLIPFAIGDLFIALSIAGVLLYPVYARCFQKKKWKRILLNDVEYLLWIYAWFYLAWGLNYSQPNFYQRTNIPYTAYTPENFQEFVDDYVEKLNASYMDVTSVNKDLICREIVSGYHQISDTLGVHHPFHKSPRVKTMLFTPLISAVGVTGSMGPFFCEFTLNGDLLPSQYPATYAHELAHLLGISGEAEANFYAYQVCTRSQSQDIRFCGYFSVLGHVLGNARQLMGEEEYKELFNRIRPEIIELAQKNREYWMKKYSPLAGNIQDWIYDLYLKGNKIQSGRKNYSEVVGLLISYHTYCTGKKK
ncbi:DUF3810 domain-containing protein [Bacteroides sp. UBA939]|uniref:DUF3810 domain-containing protein n=1 Tax=Bacteroides sp. UBA939 TaxID=1946092 RepID=UPI0025B7FE2C|nr:DUF3810 domain-containing protein [Bacteroides sp. UBA939]